MIAYFAAIPAVLYPVICHKMGINNEKKAVLFIDENTYNTRNLFFLTKSLKDYNIFYDVIACKMRLNFPSNMSMDVAEKQVIENYDNIFDNCKYDILSFEEIFMMNDSWDGEQGVYFNYKHIPYIWVETTKNYFPVPSAELRGRCYVNLINKYKACGPLAEYASACINDLSDLSKEWLEKSGKKYICWNRDKCFNSFSEKEIDALISAFDLDKLEEIDTDSTLIIKNSFGYLMQFCNHISAILKRSHYSKEEIFSIMDKVSIDFFASDSKKVYLKNHIHDPLDETKTKLLYGEKIISLPNVLFEVMYRYFCVNNIRFKKVIGATSTSLEALKNDCCDEYYILGKDFARSWWFYISLYVSLLFAYEQGFRKIYCNDFLVSQLELLKKELKYDIEIYDFINNNLYELKDSAIINDTLSNTNFPLKAVDKSSIAILINVDMADSFLDCPFNTLIPICIQKKQIDDVECDLLFRKETLWIYSTSVKIKKGAKNFVFVHTLKNLGMKVFSEKTTSFQAFELYEAIKNKFENEKLNQIVKQQQTQLDLLTQYITNQHSFERSLISGTDILMYLNILNIIKSKYLIILAVRDTPGDLLPDEVIEKIHSLGFTDFCKELWRMYIGVSLKSTIVFNKSGEKIEAPVTYTLRGNNLNLNAVSKAWRNGNQASVVINGNEYSVNIRGLNFVVYDADNDKLVDSIGYDRHTNDERFVRK